MTTIEITQQAIVTQGILPLFFNKSSEVSIAILRALYKAGIRAVEYTNRGPEAVANLKEMVAIRDSEMPGLLIGIGTIKTIEQAKEFRSVGADYFISPGFVPEVAAYSKSHDILYSPGCMTPTEIISAENAGIKLIKLFPGNSLKTDFLNAIKDIFPDLDFMVTGGVDTTPDSINSWFNSGVAAVGMGSKLISKQVMEDQNYDQITSQTQNILEIIRNIKN